MPSAGSCDSWLVSVPGGSQISSVDPLDLSIVIPYFPAAGRGGSVPSVILGGLTVNFVWAIEKCCAGSRIKGMKNVYSLKWGIIMALLIFRNSGSILGPNVVCTMLLIPKCRWHYQHFILHSWLSQFLLFLPQVLCCEFNRLVLKRVFIQDGQVDVLSSLSAFEIWTTKVVQFQPSNFSLFSGFLAWGLISPPSGMGISRDYKLSSQIQSLEVDFPKSVP